MVFIEAGVLLSPEACHHLERALDLALRDARRQGSRVPHSAESAIRDIRRAALAYRSRDQTEVAAGVAGVDATNSGGVEDRGPILTTADAGRLLRMGESGVREAIRAGRLPGHRLGRFWGIYAADVDDYNRRRSEHPERLDHREEPDT